MNPLKALTRHGSVGSISFAVEELIGRATINTTPVATLDAFRDHGRVRNSLTEDLVDPQRTLDKAQELGLDPRQRHGRARGRGCATLRRFLRQAARCRE